MYPRLRTYAGLVLAAQVLSLGPRPARADPLWHILADTLLYSDTDNVQVISPQLGVSRDLEGDDGGSISVRSVVDVVSAASVDVVSEATTRFSETREELDLAASKTYGEVLRSASYRYSHEPDYVSHGGRIGLTLPFRSHDTTLSAGYGLTFDSVRLHGTPAANFSETKYTHTADASLTQVVSPETLVRLAYTLTVQTGFLEKPYRHVPLFTEAALASADAAGVSIGLDTFADYALAARPLENVPDQRTRSALAVRAMHYLPGKRASIKLDYQLYADSWSVIAHTLEPAFYQQLNDHWRLRTYARFYTQSAASFWRKLYVVDNQQSVLRWRTVDRGLSSYWSTTLGARAEWARGRSSLYFAANALYTHYQDFIYLDSLVALVGQTGYRRQF